MNTDFDWWPKSPRDDYNDDDGVIPTNTKTSAPHLGSASLNLPCNTILLFPHLTNCSNTFPKINHLNLVIPGRRWYMTHVTIRERGGG